MTRFDEPSIETLVGAMHEMWNLLTESEKQFLLEGMKVCRFKRGEMIYKEGESPDNLLCLVTGKVKIFRDGYGGRSLINRVLRPVQYFGYRASMASEPYVTAASAFEESVVVNIPMLRVNEVMKHNNALCGFFIRALAVDLGLADKRIVSLTQKHVRARLAEALLSLLEIYGFEADGHTLSSQILREDMASLSNMTTSNAIRTLASFADEGLIEVHGRQIKILDLGGLMRVSDYG